MKNPNPILEVKNLKKYFTVRKTILAALSSKKKEFVRAVDDISFSVGRGKILGFVGESGCGKSTLSRTLLRLIKPSGGHVLYNGTDLLSLNKKSFKPYRRRFQMIYQDPFGSLNPRRTVSDTLRQTIKIHRLADSNAAANALIEQTLKQVDLNPVDEYWDKYPANLSGGQLQRVSIGRVMVLRPKLVIADEPVSMLDVSVRIGILELIANVRDQFGVSFIYITHDVATARYVCDRIAIMYLGKIVEIGETEEILKRPLHPYTQALVAAVPVPDPTVELPELPIKGYVPVIPSYSNPGCNFSPRCPYRMEHCRLKAPQMTEMGNGHLVACFKISNS